MIILGKTSDDKGTQLETLTRDILMKMGCKNIQVNFVSSGGEEIDVIADYLIPTVGAIQNRRLVCECKAHTRPIDMPPWLKFLGTVYSEEARLGNEVSGCFIALSGVNGNVSGNYDQLRIQRPNITLVKGDTLLDEVKKLYEVCDVEVVNTSLAKFTARRYRLLEVAYHERDVYWVVVFEDDAYTILTAEAKPVESERLGSLRTMIEDALSARPFIGLKQEAEAQRRAVQAKKSVVSQLMTNNGRMKESELLSGGAFSFTKQELDMAIEELIRESWIAESTDKTEIRFPDEDQNTFYSQLAELYRFLFGGEAAFDVLGLLKSSFYESHINEEFVKAIQRIQGNLPLTAADIEVAIKLLKWSPSAVLWAVQPDQMIITHRNDVNFKDNEEMNRFGLNYFFRQLHRSLSSDLKSPIERSYLLDVFKIREIQSTEAIVVKSSAGVELEIDLKQRLGIGYLDDGLRGPDGSNSIMLLMLKAAPEPWDVSPWQTKDGNVDNAVVGDP